MAELQKLGKTADFFDMMGIPSNLLERNLPENVALDRLGDGFTQDGMKSGMLCTARSGSSLLSVALEAYGFDFQEFLNGNGYLLNLIKRQEITKFSQLAPELEAAATHQGRLSSKLTVINLAYLFLLGEFPKNMDRWRFIYLRRSNLVQQSISSVIAKKTNQWTGVMEAKGTVDVDDYDFDAIMNGVVSFNNSNRLLERFIGIFGLNVHNVVYEDFVKDQKSSLREIAIFLGAHPNDYPNAMQQEPWIKKQATSLNDVWEDRFRTEVRRRSLSILETE